MCPGSGSWSSHGGLVAYPHTTSSSWGKPSSHLISRLFASTLTSPPRPGVATTRSPNESRRMLEFPMLVVHWGSSVSWSHAVISPDVKRFAVTRRKNWQSRPDSNWRFRLERPAS